MDNSFAGLREVYMYADRQLDIEGRAACIAAIMEILRKSDDMAERQEISEFLVLHFPVIVLAAMEYVHAHRGKQAEYYLNLLEPEHYAAMSLPYDYWLGRALYEQEKWELAAQAFERELQNKSDNELACFYRGNCFFQLKENMRAAMEYQKAITINNSFPEAVNNLQMSIGYRSQSLAYISHLRVYDLEPFLQDDSKYLEIPIFINSRDRVGTLQSLIDWLLTAGYKNIHVIDNDSTYEPLLSYYVTLLQRGIKIWRLPGNFGHTALWKSQLLNILHVKTPYVYTDSDVVPDENCPKNILATMLATLNTHRYLKKVGLSLHIDDITYYNRAYVYDIEEKMQHIRVSEGYFQSTDTTFALYRNIRHYSIREAFRTGGNMMARHIPWYYDYDNLPADERYYMEHANSSSTLTEKWKEDKGLR